VEMCALLEALQREVGFDESFLGEVVGCGVGAGC
jgi:hypothetical protein